MRRLNLSPIPVISIITSLVLLALPFMVFVLVALMWPRALHHSALSLSSLLLVIVVDGLVLYCVAKNSVWEDAAGLHIQAMGILRRFIPFNQVDWAQARYVDLRQDSSLRLRWRTMGMGLPGYQSGYFRLANRQKCFAICRGSEVVYLPLMDGTAVMLSLADGHAWLRHQSKV